MWKGLMINIIFSIITTVLSITISFATELSLSGVELKREGDLLFERGDMRGSAIKYLKAIESGYPFTEEELLNMAKRISWAGYLLEAERILRKIIEGNPNNREALLHLGRVLSWQGRQISTLKLIDSLLKEQVDNRDALFVRANALRYLGRPDLALPIYNKLLSEGEDFDIRLAQSYAYLQMGIPTKARESFSKLKPTLPYQEKEYSELKKYLLEAFSPSVRVGYGYFRDSDKNELNTLMIKIEKFIRDTKVSFNVLHRDAQDQRFKSETQDYQLTFTKRIIERYLIDGTIGLTKGGMNDYFVTGGIGIERYILNGFVRFNIRKSLLLETRELIDRQISVDSFNLNLSQVLTDRWNLFGGFEYRNYSDSNKAININSHFKYKLNFSYPLFLIGYRVIYLNFKEHKYNGYFDPKDYLSHQVTLTILYENPRLLLYLEPYTGIQEYNRYGQRKSEWIYGGSLTISKRLKPGINFDIQMDGGNYAAGTTTGWKYYQMRVNLRYSF